MSLLRDAWSHLLVWAPPSLRVAVAVVVTSAVLAKVLPKALGACGLALRRCSEPVVALLTFPEYLTTSVSRRMAWPLLPGTYAYGRFLDGIARAGTAVGAPLESLLARRFRFPWKTTVGIAAALIASWYSVQGMPSGAPRTVLTNVNSDVTRVDYWLATGQWAPSAAFRLNCPPGTATPTPAPSKSPTKKPTPKKSPTKKATAK